MYIYLLMIDSPEDQSKFTKLYEAYAKMMYYEAYKILNNHQDAEDAVHYAFVKIAENIEIIDGTINNRTKTFVATIVRHKAIDMYRHKQRHPTVDLDSCTEFTIDYHGGNEVTACMAKLSEKYQTVLLLKYVHGYSSKEVAKILGLTEANVIKIDQRAKKKLEELCKKEGIF